MNVLKYKLLSILLLTVLLLTIQSCGEKQVSTTPRINQSDSINKSKIDIEKAPKLSAVYDSYDDLAYLFNHRNDTTYVINFWATWCSPCIAELPYFEDLNRRYNDKLLKVVLISLDSKKHIDSKLRPFIQKEKLMSHIVSLNDPDFNTWIDKVDPEWDGAIPVTIIYNKEEYEIIKGEFDNYEELNTIVKSYLKI
jgi:thiol-disulfide isomerase/thioredoxin